MSYNRDLINKEKSQPKKSMTEQESFATLRIKATEHLKQVDPVLNHAIELVGPCTIEPEPNLFEALVDAIVSQQISVQAADAIMARIRQAVPDGKITPDTLLPLAYEDLRSLGFSNAKARYVRNLLEHILTGQLDLERLPELDDETIIQQLTAVKGIGRWTAEMILIFSLARPDVLPVDDLGLVEGVRQAYGLPERPGRKELLALGERWKPYRTFATWYIWRWRRYTMKDDRKRTRIVSL